MLTPLLIPYLLVFWTLQILANVAFKYGSFAETWKSKLWLGGFIFGNLVGSTSILILMLIFRLIPNNSNLASVLAGSGGFIGSQMLLAYLFRSKLAPTQWVGIILVAVGTAVTTLGGAAP